MNVPIEKKVVIHECNMSSLVFFLNPGVTLKEDNERGRITPFSQTSASVGEKGLFGTVSNG